MIDKEKGNLAIKEIVNTEINNDSFGIHNINILFYNIKQDYPHVPTIRYLVNLSSIELITLASKNSYKKNYFKTIEIALLYMNWVSEDIKKNYNKNIKTYFNVLEIYNGISEEEMMKYW